MCPPHLSSGCYNKIPSSGCLNRKDFFLKILEARSPRSRSWQLSGEDSVHGLQLDGFLWCPHMVERKILSPPLSLSFLVLTQGYYMFIDFRETEEGRETEISIGCLPYVNPQSRYVSLSLSPGSCFAPIVGLPVYTAPEGWRQCDQVLKMLLKPLDSGKKLSSNTLFFVLLKSF